MKRPATFCTAATALALALMSGKQLSHVDRAKFVQFSAGVACQ
jgi:hypothetical protein